MTIDSFQAEVISCGARIWCMAPWPAIRTWLEEPSVVEVMLNLMGVDRSAVDRPGRDAGATGCRRGRAHRAAGGSPCRGRGPSGQPEGAGRAARDGEKVRGLLPPVVAAPTLIRKPAVAVFTDDYAAAGIMTMGEAGCAFGRPLPTAAISSWSAAPQPARRRRHRALAEVAKTADRVVLIEDTRELQCRAANLSPCAPRGGVASLSDLVRSFAPRARPHGSIGEVRAPA